MKNIYFDDVLDDISIDFVGVFMLWSSVTFH